MNKLAKDCMKKIHDDADLDDDGVINGIEGAEVNKIIYIFF